MWQVTAFNGRTKAVPGVSGPRLSADNGTALGKAGVPEEMDGMKLVLAGLSEFSAGRKKGAGPKRCCLGWVWGVQLAAISVGPDWHPETGKEIQKHSWVGIIEPQKTQNPQNAIIDHLTRFWEKNLVLCTKVVTVQSSWLSFIFTHPQGAANSPPLGWEPLAGGKSAP